jgi:hypothetical protein
MNVWLLWFNKKIIINNNNNNITNAHVWKTVICFIPVLDWLVWLQQEHRDYFVNIQQTSFIEADSSSADQEISKYFMEPEGTLPY